MRNLFNKCFKFKSKKINTYEEEPIMNMANTNINYDKNDISSLSRRVNNMCHQWKISRLNALELINNVEMRQSIEP